MAHNSSYENAYEEAFYNPVTPDRFADVMLIGDSTFSFRSAPSRLNRAAQGLFRGRLSSKYSHAAICLRPGLWLHAAPGAGVSLMNFYQVWQYIRHGSKKNVAVFRPAIEDKPLYKQLRGSEFAFEVYKNPYVLLFMLGHKNVFSKEFFKQKFFCSELVVRILYEVELVGDPRSHRYLPIDLAILLSKKGWERVEKKELISPLEDQTVQRFVELGAQGDDAAKAEMDRILQKSRGTRAFSTMETLRYLHNVNSFLQYSLDQKAVSRMKELLNGSDKLRDELIDDLHGKLRLNKARFIAGKDGIVDSQDVVANTRRKNDDELKNIREENEKLISEIRQRLQK